MEGGWAPAKRMGSRFLCWLEGPAGFEMPSRPSVDVHQAAAWVGPEIGRAVWAADAVLKSPRSHRAGGVNSSGDTSTGRALRAHFSWGDPAKSAWAPLRWLQPTLQGWPCFRRLGTPLPCNSFLQPFLLPRPPFPPTGSLHPLGQQSRQRI